VNRIKSRRSIASDSRWSYPQASISVWRIKRVYFLHLIKKIDNLWNAMVLDELGMGNNYNNTVSCHLKQGIYSPTKIYQADNNVAEFHLFFLKTRQNLY
jgi:hypothetical protein